MLNWKGVFTCGMSYNIKPTILLRLSYMFRPNLMMVFAIKAETLSCLL